MQTLLGGEVKHWQVSYLEVQDAGAEPEKLQGQWDDAGGVFQKWSGRAMLWERTELLMQSRESTQQSACWD